ncbi:MAG: TetR/AcrR family transcriptional regulator [Aquisalinus sp.]|nr:TetR/AcrR family transcriptional regulator [Aquisalinus sp.]
MTKAEGKQAAHKPIASSGNSPRERLETREDMIILQAYKLFQEKGYSRTTTSEIAKLSGVSEGTIFNHFSNKDALASAVIERFYARLTEEAGIGVQGKKKTREKLIFLAAHHLENILESQRILQMALLFDFTLEMKADNPLYRMNRKYVAVFDQVIREGILRGDLPESVSSWLLRDTFYGALEYAMRTMLLRGQRDEVEVFVTGLVDMVLQTEQDAAQNTPSGPQLIKLAKSLEKTVARFEVLERAKKKAE